MGDNIQSVSCLIIIRNFANNGAPANYLSRVISVGKANGNRKAVLRETQLYDKFLEPE